ncbi:MAG: hypothetical protein ACE5KD_00885 [Candidatus Bathyarchaeia archaeon]
MAHKFVRNIAGYSQHLAEKNELKIKPKIKEKDKKIGKLSFPTMRCMNCGDKFKLDKPVVLCKPCREEINIWLKHKPELVPRLYKKYGGLNERR